MEWYNDYPHLGYDLSGKQTLKPASGDEVGEHHCAVTSVCPGMVYGKWTECAESCSSESL